MSTNIFAPCDDMDEQHIRLIAEANNSKTEIEHHINNAMLRGWRLGVRDSNGRGYDWTLADLHHKGADAERPMCLGVFNDWTPPEESTPVLDPDYDPTPYCSHCGAKERRFCACGPISKDD